MIKNCIIINLDHRTDLLDKLNNFIENWIKDGKIFHRMSGTFYKNKTHILNEYIKNNRININGAGFRNSKNSFLGELGAYNSHYECWKYITDNKLDNCLILEDGIKFLRNDFKNLTINNDIDLLYINKEMKKDKNELIGYGTQGYVLSYIGALLLQKLCYTLIYPIDIQMRSICNNNLIKSDVLSVPFVKRNNNRISSIEEIINDQNYINNKQNMNTIINRIIIKMIEKNINLDDFM
jgi:GR25 family glycosyltransferase involved in LPS biosynthesis